MTLFGSIMFLKTILSSGGQGVHMKFGGKHFIPCSPSPLHILCQTLLLRGLEEPAARGLGSGKGADQRATDLCPLFL